MPGGENVLLHCKILLCIFFFQKLQSVKETFITEINKNICSRIDNMEKNILCLYRVEKTFYTQQNLIRFVSKSGHVTLSFQKSYC